MIVAYSCRIIALPLQSIAACKAAIFEVRPLAMDEPSKLLAEETREQRYEDERRQGEKIVAGIESSAWGWAGPAGTIRAERRADFLIQAAGLKPGIDCLELGCGTGEFTTRLVRAGCNLYAIELS